LKHAVSSDPE